MPKRMRVPVADTRADAKPAELVREVVGVMEGSNSTWEDQSLVLPSRAEGDSLFCLAGSMDPKGLNQGGRQE